MARPDTSIGRRVDWPQLESATVLAGAAGSASDGATGVGMIITALPDLAKSYLPNALNEKLQADIARNRMWLRQVAFISNAANRAGGATNNYDWRINCYRAGVLQGCLAYYTMSVATDIGASTTTAGSVQTITPTAMTGIVPGLALYVDSGQATAELIYVISTTATTFTAYFTQAHSASATLTSEMLLNTPIVFVPTKAISGGTSSTSITAGARTVTPTTAAMMYGIHVGDWLLFSGGAGTAETVQVTAVTNTTFTATFLNSHSGGYTFTTATNPNVAAANPSAGNSENFTLIGGDVLKIERLSNNATGLASDAGVVQVEWVPAGIGR